MRRPDRSSSPRSLLLIALLSAACQTGAPAVPETTAPAARPAAPASDMREPNTLAGIYTVAQAERGRAVFDDICSTCHNAEEWQDEGFKARWNGESIYRFWSWIYERMPDDAPPYSLPREQVSDVLTYILQLNGLPAGDTELGSDDDSIDQHWLYWSAAGS